MDDMWSIEVWDKVKYLFPDNSNGSRIIITSRLSNVALHLTGSKIGLEMNFLNEDISWKLLRKIVFGEHDCPLELEEIGRKIAKNCKGLPLSVVVIGGLLSKSEYTQEYWKYIAENLNSIVNIEKNEHCLNLLYTSYSHLPVYLKPCFLYMSVFPEDYEIHVSELIKLWVAEGFLKPIIDKSLEEVAREYLNDLIDRNLILVKKWGYTGKVKLVNMHDLLRNLCLREAKKDKFLHNLDKFPQGISTQRRIAIHPSTLEKDRYYLPRIHDALQSAPIARSLICYNLEVSQSPKFRLLRVLQAVEKYSSYLEAIIIQLFNLRYLAINICYEPENSRFPSSIYLLWNLQTLIIKDVTISATFDIWKMTQLKHVEFDTLYVPNPGQDDFVLENLQTLLRVVNFRCSEKIVRRIPSIKKLKIFYNKKFMESHCSLNNLGFLHKLETLGFYFDAPKKSIQSDLLQNLTFPHSLEKLSLVGSCLNWEDMATKIGLLPVLQVLKLRADSFTGPKWETVEGQFCSLKFLKIEFCEDLEYWKTESTHFPCLEHLVLVCLHKLKEIPWGIGETPTLKLIELDNCSDSAVISAKKIVEEQELLGNEDLQVRVRSWYRNYDEVESLVESLASHNFLVE